MTHSFPSKGFNLALALGTVAALGSSIAFADGPVLPMPGQNHVKLFGPGEKVQFSAPSDPLNTTNILNSTTPAVNPLNPPLSPFKQVQEDLFGPIGNAIEPVNSMQGVMSVPVEQQEDQQAPKSRRTREREDARRNWAFTDLNDLDPQPTPEEMLGVQEIDDATGLEKKPVSAVQKYLNRADQNQQQDKKTPLQQIEDRQARQMAYGTNVYDPMAQPYMGNNYYEKTIFSPGNFSDKSGADGNDNLSSFSGQAFDPQQAIAIETKAKKDRDAAFDHLLNHTQPGSNPGDSQTGLSSVSQYLNPTPALTTSPQNNSVFRSPLDPIAAVPDPNSSLHITALDDPTYRALGMPQPVTTLPTQPPPPQKTALSVQKMIDPFAANVYKPKF